MSNIVGRLRIELPGSQLQSKQECFEQLKENGKTVLKPIAGMTNKSILEFRTKYYDKKSKSTKIKTFTAIVHTRKCKPAFQSIPITQEAYKYFISKDSVVSGITPAKWASFSNSVRLRCHCEAIAYDRGGKFVDVTLFK